MCFPERQDSYLQYKKLEMIKLTFLLSGDSSLGRELLTKLLPPSELLLLSLSSSTVSCGCSPVIVWYTRLPPDCACSISRSASTTWNSFVSAWQTTGEKTSLNTVTKVFNTPQNTQGLNNVHKHLYRLYTEIMILLPLRDLNPFYYLYVHYFTVLLVSRLNSVKWYDAR